MARLVIKSGESAKGVIDLKPGLNTVGRSPSNDHPLNHPAISEEHCRIIVEKEFIMVQDMDSASGTFIGGQQIGESVLYCGQTLQIGPFQMELETDALRLAIPELPPIENPFEPPAPSTLTDGYAACLSHEERHAIWDCTHCGRQYCDECIRKLRRVGGVYLRLCAACGAQCRLSEWSEMMKSRKLSFFAKVADKLKTSLKRTKLMVSTGKAIPARREKQRTRTR